MNCRDEKKLLRERMKNLRAELSICSFRQNSQAIINRCVRLEEWYYANTVHIYVSALNNEADTLGLIYKMFDNGKRVVVPKCGNEAHRLLNIRIESFDELSVGKYSLMEPGYKTEREVAPLTFDLVISPLLAFDRKGGRLGFGGGYYDGLFKECTCPKIGLGYTFQEVDTVPVEPHDEKLDIIITDSEIIRIKQDE